MLFNESYIHEAEAMRDKLNEVSPSFCLAKWKQVTLHLQNGHTHSCHYPPEHLIPLAEIAQDPRALHNTREKMLQRKMMKEGQRPPGCSHCWNIEDCSKTVSDRHLKSSEPWAAPTFDEVKNAEWDAQVNPSYLEVSFSNACNLKCSYCAPQVSSSWMNEVVEKGPVPLANGQSHHHLDYLKRMSLMPIAEEGNPYVEAFWKWWPDLYPSLQVLRITGGEPLLSSNTYRIFDWIKTHPHPNLSLGINSNLSVPQPLFDKFIEGTRALKKDKKISKLLIFTSLDTWGKGAEYIRSGLDLKSWEHNLLRVLNEIPDAELTIMCTFNNLSIGGFEKLLEKVLKWRALYAPDRPWNLGLNISNLREPIWQSVQILDEKNLDRLRKLHRSMKRMQAKEEKAGRFGFLKIEQERMESLLSWAQQSPAPETLRSARANFYHFFTAHDLRRGTNFRKTFPEMKKFWELCRSEARIAPHENLSVR